ncbi:MAG: hypothetical protein R3C99_13555 [Pirellulaceae bacterium]
MTRTCAGFIAVALLGLFASQGWAVETDALRQKQAAQEKARLLTRELVSGILDIQVRQLEENGLTQLPIYGEIRQMRVNINELVDAEMRDVVELLVKAQEGSQTERIENFTKARESVRQVVMTLMAERQKLLKRLQIARLSAQVRQLIQMETAAMTTTRSLDELPAADRERLTLLTIQDQRDVKALFLVLVETLADVSTWGGPAGAGAADGLRILKTAQVGGELDLADNHLASANHADAAASQLAVIRGLRLLLDKLEETQGLISSDREAALKMVREMIEKQEKLKEQTEKTSPEDPKFEELVDQQSELNQELGKLAETLAEFPSTETLVEQAKAAAFEATAELFDRETETAAAEQSKVIGNLAQIEAELQSGIEADSTDKSAAELAAEVEQLERVQEQLEQAAEQQAAATEKAAEAAAAAKQQRAGRQDIRTKAAAQATEEAPCRPRSGRDWPMLKPPSKKRPPHWRTPR